MSKEQNEIIKRALEPIAEKIAIAQGCRLYDLDLVGLGSQRTLRVFVDRSDVPVSIDDCANVSRALSEVLDDENGEFSKMIPDGAYQLEVSSPGIERELSKDWHFAGAVGSLVEVKLKENLGTLGFASSKLASAKKLKARFKSLSDGLIELELETKELVKLNLTSFDKVKTLFEMPNSGKKEKNN